MIRVGLVGCVKSKRGSPAPARDLYSSSLFRGRRAYVESTCDRWFVLSAKHGLVAPDATIEPYDVALKDESAFARLAWSRQVVGQLRNALGSLSGVIFEIHAGAAYRGDLVPLLRREGAAVEEPAARLNQGQQLAFYANQGVRHAIGSESESERNNRTPRKRLLPRVHRSVLDAKTTHACVDAPAPSIRAPTASGPRVKEEVHVVHAMVTNVRPLAPFDYRWPVAIESFSIGWDFDLVVDGLTVPVRHGIGRRFVFGRDRVHSVTWLRGQPVVEGAEVEDYPTTHALVSALKGVDRRDARTMNDVPTGYESFRVVTHRDEIQGPNARRGLAVKIREDDLAGWGLYAWLRARDRQVVQSREASPARDEDVTRLSEAVPPAIRHSEVEVVQALLAHGQRLASLKSGDFTPDPEANAFVRADPFAFLVAVICDEQVRFEAAWNAPLELRRRLGHWNIARIAAEPHAVTAAFAHRPALHRWVAKTAERVSKAAAKVLLDYGGDASRIWSPGTSAEKLRRRLETFDGIGQKKAAMAVEILEAGIGADIHELTGSDVAVDIHVRRVFLRTGLVGRDDAAHIVATARRLNPQRPGALDNPAWDIGRRCCHASRPECDVCPLAAVCPRLIDRAAGVRGA